MESTECNNPTGLGPHVPGLASRRLKFDSEHHNNEELPPHSSAGTSWLWMGEEVVVSAMCIPITRTMHISIPPLGNQWSGQELWERENLKYLSILTSRWENPTKIQKSRKHISQLFSLALILRPSNTLVCSIPVEFFVDKAFKYLQSNLDWIRWSICFLYIFNQFSESYDNRIKKGKHIFRDVSMVKGSRN